MTIGLFLAILTGPITGNEEDMSDRAVENFMSDQAKRGLSPASLKTLKGDLSTFCTWWEQSRQRPFSAQQLMARDLRQWK